MGATVSATHKKCVFIALVFFFTDKPYLYAISIKSIRAIKFCMQFSTDTVSFFFASDSLLNIIISYIKWSGADFFMTVKKATLNLDNILEFPRAVTYSGESLRQVKRRNK